MTNESSLLTRINSAGGAITPLACCPAVVLIDQCDVLYDDTVWSRWLHQLIARMATFPSYQDFREWWERDYLTRVHRGELGYWEAIRELLAKSGLARGQIEEVCVAATARRKMFEESLLALPGVKTALAQLNARGLRLALFAKCAFTAPQVHRILQRMGIEGCFDEVLVSLELAKAAGASCLWTAAAARLGEHPSSIAFVSARPPHILAAQATGMLVIGIDLAVSMSDVIRVDQITDLPRVLPPGSSRALAG